MTLADWVSFPMGVLIAMVSSTVGIGGGILWMPFLMLGLKLPPETAVLTSLIIQTAGMGSGTLAYIRQKRVDIRLMLLLLALTLPGVLLGAHLTRLTQPKNLELILGLLTLFSAMIFVSANQSYGEAGLARAPWNKAGRYGWLVSVMAIASGMLSVSIGEWLVPLMRSKIGLMMRVAVGTSIATIFGTCVLGTVFHLSIGGDASFMTILWAVPGVIIGGQIGPRITERVNDRILKEVFIFLLTLIGIHLIYNSY